MDEKDVTLYLNCRNKYSVLAIWELILNILNILNVKHKKDEKFKIIEIQLEDDYIFFARFIDLENCNPNFLDEKYMISDQEILDFIKIAKKDEDVFKFIFGDFFKGLR